MNNKLATSFFILCFLIGIAKAETPPATRTASYYSVSSLKKEGTWNYSKGIMANGQRFDENALTCASWDYPLNTRLKVTNLANNKSVEVIVTDRTNKRFKNARIDLSKRAFGILTNKNFKIGLIKVEVKEVK